MCLIPSPTQFDYSIDRSVHPPIQRNIICPRTSLPTSSLFNYDPVDGDFGLYSLNGINVYFLDPRKGFAIFNRHFDNARIVVQAAYNLSESHTYVMEDFNIPLDKFRELGMLPAPLGDHWALFSNPLAVSKILHHSFLLLKSR